MSKPSPVRVLQWAAAVSAAAFLLLFFSLGLTVCPPKGGIFLASVGVALSLICFIVAIFLLSQLLRIKLTPANSIGMLLLTTLDCGAVVFIVWIVRQTLRAKGQSNL